jgi:hypothetical protein
MEDPCQPDVLLERLIGLLTQCTSTPTTEQHSKAAQEAETLFQQVLLAPAGDARELLTQQAGTWLPLVVRGMLGFGGPVAGGKGEEQSLQQAVRDSAQKCAQLMVDQGLSGLTPILVQGMMGCKGRNGSKR